MTGARTQAKRQFIIHVFRSNIYEWGKNPWYRDNKIKEAMTLRLVR